MKSGDFGQIFHKNFLCELHQIFFYAKWQKFAQKREMFVPIPWLSDAKHWIFLVGKILPFCEKYFGKNNILQQIHCFWGKFV